MSDSFATPWTPTSLLLSMDFSRQEYWSGLPCPSPTYLQDPELNSQLLHWQVGSLPLSQQGNTQWNIISHKNNKIMPFVGTCMDLEIVILSEITQTENINIIWYCIYRNLKTGTNELIYKTEIQSHILKKKNLWLLWGKGGRDKLGDWNWHIHHYV